MKSYQFRTVALCILLFSLFIACKKASKAPDFKSIKETTVVIPKGMVLIPGGAFYQGATDTDTLAMGHEKPRHLVKVDSFLMDSTEVTNAQFAQFVTATKYITLAERPVDWDVMKKQVPPGTPKPHDSLLQPGSLIFKEKPDGVPNLYDFSQWWVWQIGANWKQPQGPGSTIVGLETHPVVHIAYQDALAYCKWVGSELPTEAQWEFAARGGVEGVLFSWGNNIKELAQKNNTYTGVFPIKNDKADGYLGSAPVASFPANAFGLYDMSGNVWEWTTDWYDPNYYSGIKDSPIKNPEGPLNPINRMNEKVIKGGSFLCNATYCASFRISSRMGNTLDSSSEHKGFRTVINLW